MVDTIYAKAFPAPSLPVLHREREATEIRTGLYERDGYYRNMHVRVRSDGEVSVCGSLPRFHLGSNAGTLRRQEVERAVTALSAAFGVPPEVWRVYRLDLAATMPMPRPVSFYLDVLGPVSRMQMRRFGGETVTYVNKRRTLQFYDKGKEADLPGHLLRFELQYKKGLKRQLKREVTLADLYDPAFFAGLVGRWLEACRRVPKRRRQVLEPTGGKSDLTRQLARIGLERMGGAVVVRQEIGTWEQDRRVLHRLRAKVTELEAEGNSRADADLIGELDAAVEQAKRLALDH